MAGVAGASIGLNAGSQQNIAPALALTNGMDIVPTATNPYANGTTPISRGCTTNFIGFGFGLTDVSVDPPQDFTATASEDIVVRAVTSGTLQTPTYTAISGSVPPQSTLSWAVGSAAVVVSNSVAPTVTGTAQVGATLTSVTGTWAGTPTPTYSRVWLVGAVVTAGVAVGGYVVGGNQTTYVPTVVDVGKTVTCVVTGSNPVNTVSVASVVTAAVIAA